MTKNTCDLRMIKVQNVTDKQTNQIKADAKSLNKVTASSKLHKDLTRSCLFTEHEKRCETIAYLI